MTTATRVRNLARRAAPAVAAAALLLGSGCGGSGHAAKKPSSPTPVKQSAGAVPTAGAHPSTPAPNFTQQVPAAPAGGVPLEELYQQGKTDTVR